MRRLLSFIFIIISLETSFGQITNVRDVSEQGCFEYVLTDTTTLHSTVISLVQNPRYNLKERVRYAVSKWGEEKVKNTLIEFFENNKIGIYRLNILTLLGEIKDRTTIPYIGLSLKDTLTYGIVPLAILAISKQGFPEAVPYLGEYLMENGVDGNTGQIMVSLGLITTNEAGDYLSLFIEKHGSEYLFIQKARVILARIRQYNLSNSKFRALKHSLKTRDENFEWMIVKAGQPGSPAVSLRFLRRLCKKMKKKEITLEQYLKLLELRQDLGDKLTQLEVSMLHERNELRNY